MIKHNKDSINKILIKLDPVGLIQGGAPEDEYNVEARGEQKGSGAIISQLLPRARPFATILLCHDPLAPI